MTVQEALNAAVNTVIEWFGMIYSGFCDYIGLSEWTVFFLIIGIIGAFISGRFIYKQFWR